MSDSILWVFYFIAGYWVLTFANIGLRAFTFGFGCLLMVYSTYSGASLTLITFWWLVFFAVFVPLNFDRFRLAVISQRGLDRWQNVATPVAAKRTPWWEMQLISGNPEWQQLLSYPSPRLSTEEKDFISDVLPTLCCTDDTEATIQTLGQHGLFALAVPKRHGGLEFSSYGQSRVLAQLHHTNTNAAVLATTAIQIATVLQKYARPAAAKHLLQSLASGDVCPHIATTPVTLSQVTPTKDNTNCDLNWNGLPLPNSNRALILAPFDLGANTNDDTPLRYGVMLLDNSTSPATLPSTLSQGELDTILYLSGPVTEIHEALHAHVSQTALVMAASLEQALISAKQRSTTQHGQIAATAYTTEAVTTLCCSAMDLGQMPVTALKIALQTVLSASRTNNGVNNVIDDVIDHNEYNPAAALLLSHPRFGELQQLAQNASLEAFDDAYVPALGASISNATRSLLAAASHNRIFLSPIPGPTAKYFRQLNGFSAAFALLTDFTLQRHSSHQSSPHQQHRLLRILGHLYCSCAILKRWEDTGRVPESLPIVEVALQTQAAAVQATMMELLNNIPNRGMAWLLKRLCFPFGSWFRGPNDTSCERAGQAMRQGQPINHRFREVLGKSPLLPLPDQEQSKTVAMDDR